MNTLSSIYILLLLAIPFVVEGQSVANTVHNLSVSGPGTIKASSESEICIFCHTPHNSNPSAPQWNRELRGTTYTLYNSSTTQAVPGQPDGSSVLCLSCHDGTIALGKVLSRSVPIGFTGGITSSMRGTSNLTTDLSNDHPVSFIFNSSLAAADGELTDPKTLIGPVTLENSKLQCTSCHDPHKNLYGDFLVATTESSALCNYCHNKNYWQNTSHRTSNKSWNGTSPDPWPRTPYNTVAQNACENCHNPHTAGGQLRLVNYFQEENNCLNCHNGNVASKNVQAQFSKTYRHNVYNYTGMHDPAENALAGAMHVECADCHNPHAVNNDAASAPNANGTILGVKGIDQNGNPVSAIQYEYELCYRCHTQTTGMPAGNTARQISQNNVRLEFDTYNPSYHPVVGAGKNPNVPSLIAPLTTTSVIYCTDCHAGDGSNAPAGPHGSIFPQILKMQYNKNEPVEYSRSLYALCFSCHAESVVMSGSSFKEHARHRDFPCNDCHDPHGISSTQGNSANNSNLINFNIGSGHVTTNNGIVRFDDQGLFTGNCTLTCHGKKHDGTGY